MKAVILAAGRSTRLYPLTLDKPKSLLDVGGKCLLEYQLDALESCGISELIIVTGYLKHLIEEKVEEVRERYSFPVSFVVNPDFAETNNLYSLWSAREQVADSAFLCLHADVLFHPAILRKAARDARNILLVAESEILQETMKLKLDGDRVTGVGKHISMKEASGTFPGIAKFSAYGSRLFFAEAEGLISQGETNAYFTLAIDSLIGKGEKVGASFTGGLPWIEIDFADELADARERILPLLNTPES